MFLLCLLVGSQNKVVGWVRGRRKRTSAIVWLADRLQTSGRWQLSARVCDDLMLEMGRKVFWRRRRRQRRRRRRRRRPPFLFSRGRILADYWRWSRRWQHRRRTGCWWYRWHRSCDSRFLWSSTYFWPRIAPGCMLLLLHTLARLPCNTDRRQWKWHVTFKATMKENNMKQGRRQAADKQDVVCIHQRRRLSNRRSTADRRRCASSWLEAAHGTNWRHVLGPNHCRAR